MNKFLLYLCLLSLSICIWHTDAQAQEINFNRAVFREIVNVDYFLRHPIEGVEIADTPYHYLEYVIFHKPIVFAFASFDSLADFQRWRFTWTANFLGTRFASTANFYYAQFDSLATFVWTECLSTADFRGAHFASTANFQDARFASSAIFDVAQFDSTVSFFYTHFDRIASFRFARFKYDAYFYRSMLPRKFDFRFVTDISKEIDFSDALLDTGASKCQIALVGSDISNIKLDMRLFELWFPADTIWAKDSSGHNVVGRIDTITFDKRIGVYEQVLKKLKDDGFMESYQILDIDYKRLKYEHNEPWGAFVNFLDSNWWNYGYNPERVFAISAGIWCLFSLVNLATYKRLSNGVYAIGFLDAMRTRVGNPVKRAFSYVLKVIAYTAIVFFGLKMDLEKFKDGALKRHPFLFSCLIFEYVVGLVCLGFIINIIFTR